MKKAIVTGGTGFVGKWLIKELTRKGIEVIVLARKCPQKEEQVNGCGVRYILYDSDEYGGCVWRSREALTLFIIWHGAAYRRRRRMTVTFNCIISGFP